MIRLYQYQICPFCNKSSTALKYLKRAFMPIEVNPLTKHEVSSIFADGYCKVPIAMFGEVGDTSFTTDHITCSLGKEAVRDSNVIVERALLDVPDSYLDKDHFMSEAAMAWVDWSDRDLAVCMYPNISRSLRECWKALWYLNVKYHPLEGIWIRIACTLGMRFANKKMLVKYKIEKGKERDALWKHLEVWENAIEGKMFRGGDKPDMSDMAIHGCMKAVENMSVHNEILEKYPKFAAWYKRLDEIIIAREFELSNEHKFRVRCNYQQNGRVHPDHYDRFFRPG